ncbi:hypothetical protein ACMD2_25194 [Ananas comosus]|uniref:Uncharacterized protein n=1 Tax=Ananas comosus TaxID=4615 RepID=A0A199VK77_ANACO|nr:hypothetical protein ACMD2_25194 [Ananas comosus]
MGNQQSRWKLEKMFGIRRYVRLSSSSQVEPLLQADGCAETKYLQFTDDCKADIETIRKRNSVLERKVDDLTRKVNDLLSRTSKYEKDNKAEIERMQTKNANLGSEIKQCEKDNKAEIERMQRKIANLENEIKNLKRKIAALDIKSANSRGMELSATCLTSQLILSEPKDIISPIGSLFTDD